MNLRLARAIRAGLLAFAAFAFGFPVAGLRLAVALSFHLAFNAVAADFARVLGGDLVSIELAGHLKRNFFSFKFRFFDGRVPASARNGPGELFAIELQLEGDFSSLAVLA